MGQAMFGPAKSRGSAIAIGVAPARLCCEQAATRGERRLGAFDWLRIVGCVGIIWFHVKAPGYQVGYSGLLILMAISVALATMSSEKRAVVDILQRRFKRLLVPWFFWSGVYLTLILLERSIDQMHHKVALEPWMWFTGPSLHLWYLPVAFVVTVVVALASRLGYYPRSAKATVVWSLLVAFSIPLSSWVNTGLPVLIPMTQSMFILPAVLVGLAGGASAASLPPSVCRVSIILGGIAAGCCVGWMVGVPGVLVPYALGLGVSAVSLELRVRATPLVRCFSDLSFGVYLVHPMLAHAMVRQVGSENPTLLALLVTGFSFALAAGLKRTPLRVFI